MNLNITAQEMISVPKHLRETLAGIVELGNFLIANPDLPAATSIGAHLMTDAEGFEALADARGWDDVNRRHGCRSEYAVGPNPSGLSVSVAVFRSKDRS